jgi:hypothetical protein
MTLFAPLEVATGKVSKACYPRASLSGVPVLPPVGSGIQRRWITALVRRVMTRDRPILPAQSSVNASVPLHGKESHLVSPYRHFRGSFSDVETFPVYVIRCSDAA